MAKKNRGDNMVRALPAGEEDPQDVDTSELEPSLLDSEAQAESGLLDDETDYDPSLDSNDEEPDADGEENDRSNPGTLVEKDYPRKIVPVPVDLARTLGENGLPLSDHSWTSMVESFGAVAARRMLNREISRAKLNMPSFDELYAQQKSPFTKCPYRVRVQQALSIFSGGTSKKYAAGQGFEPNRFTWAQLRGLADSGLEFEVLQKG